MINRKDVVLIECEGAQGTGFLIGSNKVLTALHVILALDVAGHEIPAVPHINCTYFNLSRGEWSENVGFDPRRDPHSKIADWVILRVQLADGVRLWSCAAASESTQLSTCATYGFPPAYGRHGAPYHGRLTALNSPHVPLGDGVGIPLHQAYFNEALSPTGLSPQGFSGAPVVVEGAVVGIVRSFISAVPDTASTEVSPALGATVFLTPSEAVAAQGEIVLQEPARASSATSGDTPGQEPLHLRVEGSDLLLDSWLVQLAAHLLSDGPDTGDDAQVLVVDAGAGTHVVKDVPAAGLELECLLSLLNDIVLHQRLVIDEEFAGVWMDVNVGVDALRTSGVLHTRSIDMGTSVAWSAKNQVKKMLCVTPRLTEEVSAATVAFVQAKKSGAPLPKSWILQLVSGTAGNFGRSAVTRIPYSPHPVRRDLLRQTIYRSPTATDVVNLWFNNERARSYTRILGQEEFRSTHITLPPLVVQIIENSSSVEELIPTAIEYRKKYARLRRWLAKFQVAMDEEDGGDLGAHERVLNSVTQHLAGQRGEYRYGSTTLQIETGLGFMSFGKIRQKFGIRGSLNKLVTTPAGEHALEKLLNMLDLRHTSLRARIHDYIFQKCRQPPW